MNSFDAHRVTKFAATQGDPTNLVLGLFDAHLWANTNIADHEVLADIADDCGYGRNEVTDVLRAVRCRDTRRRETARRGRAHIHPPRWHGTDRRSQFQ